MIVASISAVVVSALVVYTAPNSITSRHHHWTSLPLLAMKPPLLIESEDVEKSSSNNDSSSSSSSSSSNNRGGVRVAYLGNSIQYFNDCPRFLTNLSQGAIAQQDSCLRGGASLVTLWTKGNGMQHKFATMNAKITTVLPVGENDGEGG